MTASRTSRPESGFVLVGAVMFVLALTILGLSLFSLSSYEAQFLTDSVGELQAFHDASGGIDRARLVLIAKDELRLARNHLPPNVDSTIAWQMQSGTQEMDGTIDWDSPEPVWIRVRATYQGATKVLMSSFLPSPGIDYYRQLMTISDTLDVRPSGGTAPAAPRLPQTYINGLIWLDQPQPDVTWETHQQGTEHIAMQTSIPAPDVTGYFADWALPTTPSAGHPPSEQWSLGVPDTFTFYKSWGDDPQVPKYSVHAEGGSPRIRVSGTVVWMVEHGFRSNEPLVVEGSHRERDCLILVSRRNGRETDINNDPEWRQVGIWLQGGVVVAGARLILVCDDQVRIEHYNGLTGNTTIDNLTIYAREAWIMGPLPNGRLTITHPYPHPATDPFMDWLNENEILPGQGPRKRLTFNAGSWRESDPSP